MRKATYQTMKRLLENALNDMAILAGDKMGPSDAAWQDVAGTCATNLEALAAQLHSARRGNHEAGIVFPSPSETLEAVEQ